ncbi:MAG: hypothetical protein KDE26_09710 [Bacteroidetes bacterium]|nr:hypothetical protein [Bacteroidota bacterium]
MSESKNKSNGLEGFQEVINKYVEANYQIVEQGTRAFSKALNNKIETPDLQKLGNDIIGGAFSKMMEIHLKYAENLIDLGVKLSSDIASFYETIEIRQETEKTEIIEEQDFEVVNEESSTEKTLQEEVLHQEESDSIQPAFSEKKRSEMVLVGVPGDTLVSTFQLNGVEEEVKKGKFKASRCQSEDTGKMTNMWVKFNPNPFELYPGKTTEIEISASIPQSAQVGRYQSHVTVEGFDNSQFEVLIEVEETKGKNS